MELHVLSADRVAQLERWLLKAKETYYNTGKYAKINGVVVTDDVYDAWEDELRSLSPKSKVLRTTRGKTKGRKAKVKLPFWLGSLTKVRAGEAGFAQWRTKHPGPYVVSVKLDGYSVLIQWRAKKQEFRMYTAGDDDGMGLDISHLADHIDVPRPRFDYDVRAELIMPQASFKKYTAEFANPRNAMASVATRTTPHAIVKHAQLIAHDLLSQRLAPSKMFARLKAIGFQVPIHKIVANISEESLTKQLQALKESHKYEIDGLVVAQDKAFPNPKSGNPTSVVAFKLGRDASTVDVKVTSVTWEASKLGRLAPTIQIEPTKIGGVTVTNATGHSAYFIVHGYVKKDAKKNVGKPDKPIGKGAIIRVTRSGDVIPYVVAVIKPAKKPDFPQHYEWDATKTHIRATDDDSVALSGIKQITEFFRILKVEHVDIGLVTKMVNNGLNSIKKIINATPTRLMKLPGVQERSAMRAYKNIQAKIVNVPLPTLMAASGIFGAGFGVRKITPIVDKYPNILQNAKVRQAVLVDKLRQVQGLDKTAPLFAAALPKFASWLADVGITYTIPKKAKVTSDKLSGKAVCFTGFRDESLEAKIIAAGGTVASNVSSKTSILLVSNLSDDSAKVKKASALNLPIMTAEQFVKKFGL